MTVSRFISGGWISALAKVATIFVSEVRSKLSSDKYPEEIAKSIKINPPQSSGRDVYFVDIIVGGATAPMAAAFEFGSGERAEGGGEKYRIPDDLSLKPGGYTIAFPISRWENYVPPPDVDVAFFPGEISDKPYVMHPGIHPRPYIRPAIQDSYDRIKEELVVDFRAIIGTAMEGVEDSFEVRI